MKIKIAIALGSGFKAIEAEAVTIWGIPFGIHRTPGRSGWSVTHVGTGIALQSGAASREKARQSVEDSIGAHGNEKVAALLDQRLQAPPVNTLHDYVEPVREAKGKVDLKALVDIIAGAVGGLSEQEAQAVRSALSSRTGQLKAQAPSDDWGKAAWNGLQPNAWKIQFSACFIRGEAADFLKRLSAFRWPAILDKDLHTLRKLGVA